MLSLFSYSCCCSKELEEDLALLLLLLGIRRNLPFIIVSSSQRRNKSPKQSKSKMALVNCPGTLSAASCRMLTAQPSFGVRCPVTTTRGISFSSNSLSLVSFHHSQLRILSFRGDLSRLPKSELRRSFGESNTKIITKRKADLLECGHAGTSSRVLIVQRSFFVGRRRRHRIGMGAYLRRECLSMGDGGTVAVDWPVSWDGTRLPTSELDPDSPVVILLPGLTGGSDDSYVRHMVVRASQAGWRVVVFNSRGCADSPVTSPQFYSASFTEDLRRVVKHVASIYPKARLYSTGWSLGANILVRYIGQEGESCPLSGAVALCNPFDLVISDGNFRKGFNNTYDKSLAGALRKIFARHASIFEDLGGDFDVSLAANCKTVRDFDEGITRVSFGFKSVDEYYYRSGSARSIKDVKIPLLCIQAEDDPIAPSAAIPKIDIEANLNCALIITPTGGHLGWIAGASAPFGCPWTDPVVMDYLKLLDRSLERGTTFVRGGRQKGDLRLVGIQT